MKKFIFVFLIAIVLSSSPNISFAAEKSNTTTAVTLSDKEYKEIKQCFKEFNNLLKLLKLKREQHLGLIVVESKGIPLPSQIFKPIK
jgi:peptidoglycan hydrolase CwlO-like protein